jgi:hypothetical protein
VEDDKMDPDPQLEDLQQQRTRLYELLAATGDLRRGSVSETYRRCGKPNCACAREDHPGHGPRWMWTRKEAGGKTVGRQLAAGEVDKVRDEIAAWRRFIEVSREVVKVNEAICEARPVEPPGDTDVDPGTAEAERGGSSPT